MYKYIIVIDFNFRKTIISLENYFDFFINYMIIYIIYKFDN